MSLNENFEHVRQFHVRFGIPAPGLPQSIPADRLRRRASWMNEEVKELLNSDSIEDQADACIDLLYLALGGLVELGVSPHELFMIVHEANVAKLWPDGAPRLRADGKVLKPPSWADPKPQIVAEIRRQLKVAQSLS